MGYYATTSHQRFASDVATSNVATTTTTSDALLKNWELFFKSTFFVMLLAISFSKEKRRNHRGET